MDFQRKSPRTGFDSSRRIQRSFIPTLSKGAVPLRLFLKCQVQSNESGVIFKEELHRNITGLSGLSILILLFSLLSMS